MNKLAKESAGFNDGFSKGYNKGYEDGFSRGRNAGAANFTLPFEGTSIIIPTYNQLHYVKECIESIVQHTPEPYELIVIDNASDDGTAAYLKSAGGLRYRINKENLGFAGAVNQGLMLARGTTLLILNNDSVVTPNWLSNLLVCLGSNPQYGIVGPVTNYISGDQLIETSYTNIEDMQRFSRSFNQSDASRWKVTSRLTGFCMLLRREDFRRLGYFDEGFEIGNCEDDDYGLRARLLGLQLVIAKDTFIHHYGSVSMKSLNDRFDQVYEKNLAFYANKWADPHGMLSLAWQRTLNGVTLRTIDSYPTCVIVQGTGSTTYWVENGIRSPIAGAASDVQAVRVSRIDLRNWQLGEAIHVEEVMRRMNNLYGSPSGSSDIEGRLIRLQDGTVYQRKGGRLHRFMNRQAAAAWKLDHYEPLTLTQRDLQGYEEGPPIISPPVMKADNI
ncbi:glycosyltransferase family 2 protein [Paenibacillus mendelii]|uniref:Glycosyltransferase family 2 protein n=1 Tax=Paenibacillus mendelii TaxID=206163 RepID=A0ABV6J919_9BACL|nr:glycosyltransferase family 2 protein [Paenibacillus mendelii]MCQ6559727.1 glycosyltransferase family 2 protein [Paenibacillus mendelii]